MSSTTPRPRIDIITAAFNEEETLLLYEQKVKESLFTHPEFEFKVLLVDDGSEDRTWKIMSEMCARDARFTALRLSRNFGAHVAESAALACVQGDAAVMLAADLQDPPEVILRFIEAWREGAKIVWGKRRTRDDALWRRLASNFFSFIALRFALPPGSKMTSGGFMLLDRQVVHCVRQYQERNRRMVSLVAWTGFDQAVIEYDRKARIAGHPGWTFWKMIRSAYDILIGFSQLPARVMTLIGVTVFLVSVLLGVFIIFNWWFGHPLLGWSSMLLVMLSLFGLQFLMLGLVGEYLFRIYTESVQRPLYFISETVGHDKKSNSPF